jgi:inorganic phosphate transporter, PiT family
MSLIVIIIALALIFDYINGFHDAANSIATIVSTKVLTPLQAVLWAALFNFVAYFLFKDHTVANTISKTVIDTYVTLPVILSGLIAAIFWNLLTWWYGIPSSSSHTLIGGFAGAALAHAYFAKGWVAFTSVVELEKIVKTVLFIFLAPLIGMVISIFITVVTIQRKFMVKLGVILIAGLGTWMLFEYFRHDKMEDNLAKFFRVEKYRAELAKKPGDAILMAKLQKAEQRWESAKPLLAHYTDWGPDRVADSIAAQTSFDDLRQSKLRDGVIKTLRLDLLKKDAFYDETLKPRYDSMLALVDSVKPLLAAIGQNGLNNTVNNVNDVLHLSFADKERLSRYINVDLGKDLRKELAKADNRYLQYALLVMILVFIGYYVYVDLLSTPSTYKTSSMFKRLQLFSSAAFSIGHGGNDAQKVMGIIGAALIANGNISDFSEMSAWVPLSCYLAIGLGTLSGGWKIVKTMGTRITKVTPLEGVSAETAGAMTLFMTEQMGIPVSTTHTITGSIIGVGATKRLSAVRWGVTRSLLWAWILTIPVSAAVAGIVYYLTTLIL